MNIVFSVYEVSILLERMDKWGQVMFGEPRIVIDFDTFNYSQTFYMGISDYREAVLKDAVRKEIELFLKTFNTEFNSTIILVGVDKDGVFECISRLCEIRVKDPHDKNYGKADFFKNFGKADFFKSFCEQIGINVYKEEVLDFE